MGLEGPPLRDKTPDAYTPPLSKHRVSHKMPWLGIKLETFGFTVSLGTLPYR